MALGKLFKSLFGGGGDSAPASKAADPVEYKGFSIIAAPIREGGQYRTAGSIRKQVGDEIRETRFIRADNTGDENAAIEHCLYKARQIIDEQGESLLDRDMA